MDRDRSDKSDRRVREIELMSHMSLMSQRREGDGMNTFSQMAEDWLRQQAKANAQTEEIPPVEGPIDGGWGLWLLEQCAFRDRWWGGTGALYLSFARWCASHGRPVPASRAAFVAAIRGEGFQLTSDGFVYGLALREDVLAHEAFQAAPESSELPAKATPAKRCNAGSRRP